MPGTSSDSPVRTAVGLAVFAVAVLGSVVLGWGYGDFDDPVAVVIGVAVVAGLLYRQSG
ncbi:multidrug transporter [Halobaculum sp. MBLA0147]|uniref:multidrug transporter n=1 Tax=Halobaculum sp. MBLA0147 TaxID=3079934 RepID=UPI0035255BA5